MMAEHENQCIHCGRVGPTEKDHVPPRSLFPRGMRENLVTVPSCADCNRSASGDDEYIRLVCATRREASQNIGASAAWPTAFRGLSKPRKTGMKMAFLDAVRGAVELTVSGPIFEPASYEVDLARLDRVMARTIRGLHWHHRGHRLPDDYEVTVWCLDGVPEGDSAQSLRSIVERVVMAEPHKLGGGDVFEYRIQRAAGGPPDAAVWLLSVYQSTHFLGLTLPS